jgi:pyruvate/2-oxoglutarate dehydrogenase complex dihydrolipoamide dehydrogenase (E3) component
MERYDASIVGSGQAGTPLAGARWRTALVEREHVGGTCDNEGCAPTKTLIAAETAQPRSCAVLGLEGGEMMAMPQIAMTGRLPFRALRDGIFAHPTLAEGLNYLFYATDCSAAGRL